MDTPFKKRKAVEVAVYIPDFLKRGLRFFLMFYNSQYLDNYRELLVANPKFREALISHMNAVQTRLFQNMFLPPPTPKYVEGPKLLSFYQGVTDKLQFKTFYLFGEYHIPRSDSENHCVNFLGATKEEVTHFVDYIQTQLRQTSQFLDVYVEVERFSFLKNYDVQINLPIANWIKYVIVFLLNEYKNNPTKLVGFAYLQFLSKHLPPFVFFQSRSGTQLLDVFNTLKPCLNPTERRQNQEFCQLSRVHFVDVRRSFTVDYVHDIIQRLQMALFCIDTFAEKDWGDHVRISLKIFLSTKPDTVIKLFHCAGFVMNILRSFLITHILDLLQPEETSGVQILKAVRDQSPIFEKEMKKTTLESLIFEVVGKMVYEQTVVLRKGREVWKRIQEFEGMQFFDAPDDAQAEELFKEFLLAIKWLAEIIFIILTKTMDCYCLARMFRKFTPKEGQPPLEQPEFPSTYIVYTGAAHTRMYIAFIDELVNRGLFRLTKPAYTNFTGEDKYCVKLPPN